MSFYDLNKDERQRLAEKIQKELHSDFEKKSTGNLRKYFSDEDTYIRKAAYISTGRTYLSHAKLQHGILNVLTSLLKSGNYRVRQTVINAAGEIGISDFDSIENIMETGLEDKHHSPRNAVIGALKKMGEKNPKPVLIFAKKHINHPDMEIRREICHGLELRGRTYPQEILPILKELQYDKTPRVRNTLVHVIGQIAYKEGCLETVINALKKWENKKLVEDSIFEIIDVHERYKNFAVLTQKEAENYIKNNT